MKSNEILNFPSDLLRNQPVVFFDGECTLCSRTVKFLLRHNHSGNLRFASLQSDAGLRITEVAGKALQQPDSVLLLQDSKLYGYSTAAIKITEHLNFPWNFLRIMIIVPEFIRDFFYRMIVKKRYKWFGKEPYCISGGENFQKRFIS